jgi:membrane associated rhomboid family serine protease
MERSNRNVHRNAEPTGGLPIATYLLILAQVAAWVVVRRYLVAGNQWTDLALRPGTPDELGFLISPFIHLEPAHLGVNLAVLWLFGTNLERAVGSARFVLIYLGAGWFASLMHWATATSFHLYPNLGDEDAAIGSSGAVAGILAASLVRFARPRLRMPLLPRATFPVTPIIILWLAYTVVRALFTTVAGIAEGVGHWAHFAGFIFGLALAQAMALQRAARQEFLERVATEAEQSHNLPAAAQAWSALLAIRPADTDVRTSLIEARLRMGDVPGGRRLARDGLSALVRANAQAEAICTYREYLRLVPNLDLPRGVRYRIACWLADAGENEMAFGAFWDSVREDGATPSSAGALYRAGQIALERLRNPTHARDAWERLVDQFPESDWSDAAREGLRRLPAAG